MTPDRRQLLLAIASAPLLSAAPAWSRGRYDDGASDTEIKIGHTNPYSGPAASYGTIGTCIAAYWNMVNARGGINGRSVTFISLDDGYSPPKAIEAVRELVEQDKVLACFNTLGAPTNAAVHEYLNARKVPHLYVAAGASKWGEPKDFPWTMGFQPDYRTEAAIYAKHILKNVKDARIAVLMQNDDYGKDHWEGFKEGLGDQVRRVVAHATYGTIDATVEPQVAALAGSGANVFFIVAIPKFAAQAIRKAADLRWKAVRYLNSASSSVAATMQPAGFENGEGTITGRYLMDPTDRQWDDHADMRIWRVFMARYMPDADTTDGNYVYAYAVSSLMAETLTRCGDTLTRANLMRVAAGLRKFRVPLLLPGITVSTSSSDFHPVQAIRLARFSGGTWRLFGDVLAHEAS